jgi:hypothetical protein
MNQPAIFRRIGALAVAAALAGGCGVFGSRLTAENCSRIVDDMTLEQVTAILGPPTDNKTIGVGPLSATTVTWEDQHMKINVKFLNDKSGLKTCTVKEAPAAKKSG